jgi:hypothetical protein
MPSFPELGPLLSAGDFAPYVGKSYRVGTKPEPIDIRLERIIAKPMEDGRLREPFILVFSSPWSVLLVEAEYRMQPEGGAPVQMHIIPTQTPPSDRRFYHAIFN